jgi:hypothetical protein
MQEQIHETGPVGHPLLMEYFESLEGAGEAAARWRERMEAVSHHLGAADLQDDLDLTRTLAETLLCLPEEVAQFACDRCRFISSSGCYGMVLPGRLGVHPDTRAPEDDLWLILLASDLPEADAHSIVAHEIAHAWLGHDRLSPDLTPECEVEAATLTAQWGFSGIGASVDHCDRRRRTRQQG